jgi:CBS domain-containing protein
MTRDPQWLEGNSKLAFALHRMAIGHYRHIPILDELRRPAAIISVRDVLGYLTDQLDRADAP